MVTAFDAAKYERLMSGLEAVEMKLSEVKFENDSYRIDSEFFKKDFLSNEVILKNKHFNSLNDIIQLLTDGKHGGVELTENGVLFLRNTNIKTDFINLSDKRFISEVESAETKRAELKAGDVLITTIGSIVGESVVIPNGFPKATINQNLVRVVPKDKTISCYLSSFINSVYGNRQVYRMAVGNIWFLINYPNLKKLKVPVYGFNFYDAINIIHAKAEKCLSESRSLYHQAETLLLDELGLHNWQPTQANTAIKTFKNAFLKSGRLDAEYYQPKYDEIVEKMYQYGYCKLKDVFDILSNSSPSIYTDSGIKVIKTKNIRVPSVDVSQIEDCTNEKSLLVKQNDLLFASMGVGSLGRISFIEERLENYTIDGTIRIFRTKKHFEKSFMEIPTLLFLTSIFGQELIYKYVIGSTGIISISKQDVENFIIPDIKEEIAKRLTHLVLESQNLKKQSAHLLNIAKKAVEMAIEESEEAALQFIKIQTNEG